MGSIFRKGSEQTGQSSGISMDQANMARGLYNDTQGIRDRIFGGMNQFLGEGVMPSVLKSTVGLGVPIAQQEAEMANARRGIMDSMPRGGLQQRALMELPLQRLLQRDMLAANRNAIDDATRQNLFSMAGGMATGVPQQAMGGMNSAAGNLNSLGQQRMGQNASAQQGIGKALGSAAAMGGGYMLPPMGANSLGGQKKGAH